MSKKQKNEGALRRAKGNEVGRLLYAHSTAEMELAHAWDKKREIEAALQNKQYENKQDLLDNLDFYNDRIGALQKFVEDTYNEIIAKNGGAYKKV
jgi:hypothetical protein